MREAQKRPKRKQYEDERDGKSDVQESEELMGNSSPNQQPKIHPGWRGRRSRLARRLKFLVYVCAGTVFLDYTNLVLLRYHPVPAIPKRRELSTLSVLLNSGGKRELKVRIQRRDRTTHAFRCLHTNSLRSSLFQDLTAHYLACDVVSKVYLNKILPDTEYGDPGDIKRRNSLNQRFRVPEGLSTEFVLTLDDDIVIPCADMEVRGRLAKRVYGFRLTSNSQPSQLGLSVVEGHVEDQVGFFPRLFAVDEWSGKVSYRGWGKVRVCESDARSERRTPF